MNTKKIFFALVVLVIFVYSSSLDAFAQTSTRSAEKNKGQTVARKDNSIGLMFSVKGIINKVYVNVGDTVKIGDPLVELDKSSISARLAQAQTAMLTQKATLDLLTKGPKPNLIKAANIKKDRAVAVLEATKADLIESLQDAYTKAEDAVKAKADQMFNLPKSVTTTTNLQFSIQIQDVQLQTDLSSRRVMLENILASWKTSLDNLNSKSDLKSAEAQAETNMNTVKIFIDKVSAVVNFLTSDPAFSFTALRNWRLDLMTGRTNINTGLKNLSAGLGKLNEAQLDLDLKNLELNSASASPDNEQIKLQESKTTEAGAQVELLKHQIDAMTLTSPVNGIVTKVLAKPKMVVGNSAVVYIKSTKPK